MGGTFDRMSFGLCVWVSTLDLSGFGGKAWMDSLKFYEVHTIGSWRPSRLSGFAWLTERFWPAGIEHVVDTGGIDRTLRTTQWTRASSIHA